MSARLHRDGGAFAAAGLRASDPVSAEDVLRSNFVRARFEALAEWDIPVAEAHTIADAVDVDIVEAVGLLQEGCPAHLVLPILR